MRFRPAWRKLTLSIHLLVSIGWLGALFAYLAFDLTTIASEDPVVLRAAYLGMEIVALRVIVPLALITLISGVVISVGTRWGLFRHYWVLISLLLTTLATVVLLSETRTISSLATMAADASTTPEDLIAANSTLVHSVGGLLVLVLILVLNVYKPRGLTRYGWRRERKPGSSKVLGQPGAEDG